MGFKVDFEVRTYITELLSYGLDVSLVMEMPASQLCRTPSSIKQVFCIFIPLLISMVRCVGGFQFYLFLFSPLYVFSFLFCSFLYTLLIN